MPSEQPPDLDEVFERLSRTAAAGETVRLNRTEEVELHAPIRDHPTPRAELTPEQDALLHRRLDRDGG